MWHESHDISFFITNCGNHFSGSIWILIFIFENNLIIFVKIMKFIIAYDISAFSMCNRYTDLII